MKYNLDYFIEKFSKIPEDQWATGVYNDDGRCCAYGHCGSQYTRHQTEESIGLTQVMSESRFGITVINDGTHEYALKFGATPKERVVNYLKSMKK